MNMFAVAGSLKAELGGIVEESPFNRRRLLAFGTAVATPAILGTRAGRKPSCPNEDCGSLSASRPTAAPTSSPG